MVVCGSLLRHVASEVRSVASEAWALGTNFSTRDELQRVAEAVLRRRGCLSSATCWCSIESWPELVVITSHPSTIRNEKSAKSACNVSPSRALSKQPVACPSSRAHRRPLLLTMRMMIAWLLFSRHPTRLWCRGHVTDNTPMTHRLTRSGRSGLRLCAGHRTKRT